VWEHTAHVASLSQVIARRVTNVDPDTAMFAGIVHEVAGFYLLSRAAEFSRHPRWRAGRLDRTWRTGNRPRRIDQAGDTGCGDARSRSHVGRPARPAPETLGDTLLLANDLAPVESPLHQLHGATTPQAARTIDFAIGDGTLNAIMSESAHEVNRCMRC